MSFNGFAGGLLANNILQANEKIGILVMSAASPTLEHNLVELNQGHGIVFDECAAGVCTANVLRRNEGEPLLVLGSACPVMQVGVTCVTTDLLCPSHACVRVCVYVCVCVCVCVCVHRIHIQALFCSVLVAPELNSRTVRYGFLTNMSSHF